MSNFPAPVKTAIAKQVATPAPTILQQWAKGNGSVGRINPLNPQLPLTKLAM